MFTKALSLLTTISALALAQVPTGEYVVQLNGTLGQVHGAGAGACGPYADQKYYAWVSPTWSTNCNKTILVSNDAGGPMAVAVKVVDECEGCGQNDLLLSEAAFSLLSYNNPIEGDELIRWTFLD